jgi:hypothetical protein
MERASTIHLYTSTPPLTCEGRRESQHVDTKGGDSNFTINCENQDLNTRPWAVIPCQASCTSQHNQKFELMERARQFTYTLQHPHSRVTGKREKRKSTRGHKREKIKSTCGHKGGRQQFYNKLRKPGLELETLGSDTMLSSMH